MSFQQDRSRYDLQAGTSRREKLESATRPQPVAESYPRCKVHRRNRGLQIASSNRCRLTRSSPRFSDSSWPTVAEFLSAEELDEGYPTRKHFQAVANTVRAIADPAKRQQMADHHADLFSKMNPRFDHERFHAAAGTKTKKMISRNEDKSSKSFCREEALEEQLAELGFTADALPRIAELFHEAVQQGIADYPFQKALTEALANCTINPFITDEDLNVVELLANRIEELVEKISEIEAESEEIAREIIHGLAAEEAISTSRVPKKSTIEECMLSPTEDADALQEQQAHSRIMQQYLRGFGE
jgi:hypothetical protein